jgi:hypothetical protein
MMERGGTRRVGTFGKHRYAPDIEALKLLRRGLAADDREPRHPAVMIGLAATVRPCKSAHFLEFPHHGPFRPQYMLLS